MKIIEMLDKMATGEISTQAKVKYGNVRKEHASWESLDFYIYQELGRRCESEFIDFLNDEIEIIEEDKKIEHCLERDRFLCDKDEMEHLRTKIDELIDEVNRLKGEK